MDVLQSLGEGFSVAITPMNILFCLIGVTLGQLVGVLPGLGPSSAMAILLPVTFTFEPTSGIIMLAGVYYGSKYGGAITSILLNTPGEASSVMTALDGHEMAKQGRAGSALGLAAVASFIGGTLSVIGLTLFAPFLASFAIRFGPPEYTVLIIMGLSLVALLSSGSIIKALIAALLGLAIGTVGLDPMQGTERFTFGNSELIDGIDFIIVAMGLFAVAEIAKSVEQGITVERTTVTVRSLRPSLSDMILCRWTFLRSTIIGFLLGVLPGAGAAIASFIAYGTERSLSKTPKRFGHGAPEGVAAAETADNASTGGSMVPLLTLGIPGSGATAVLLGAMIVYGVRPGPLLFEDNPDFVWALIASLYVGNVILVILNLPFVPVFAAALRVPYWIIYPVILSFLVVGVYVQRGTVFDLYLLAFFGLLGYVMQRLGFPVAPVVLALVLGPLLERSLSQTFIISHGDMSVFISRPVSATLIAITALAFAVPPILRRLLKDRQPVVRHDSDQPLNPTSKDM